MPSEASATKDKPRPTPLTASYTIVSDKGYGVVPLPLASQKLKVGYRADPWATDKKRFSRFGLDANTCEALPLTVDITSAVANFRLPEILVHPTYAIIGSGTSPELGTPSTSSVVCGLRSPVFGES